MSLTEWAQVGQLLSGVSFFLTVIVSAATLVFVSRKQIDDAWLDRFRNLYGEFWNDKGMIEARQIINNKSGYDELRGILLRRNSKDRCDVSYEDYVVLESVDNFCSVLARVRSFGLSIAMSEVQEELWGELLFSFWAKKIASEPELRQYVQNHWPIMLKPVKVRRRSRYLPF